MATQAISQDVDMTLSSDILSERLVAELLEEELYSLLSAQEAERIGLEFATEASLQHGSFSLPKASQDSPPVDEAIALQLLAADLHAAADHRYAESLQALGSNVLSDKQYALKLAAAENKSAVDFEFAKKLQDSDMYDITEDADSVLGKKLVDEIIASNLNDKGKGVQKKPSPAAVGTAKGKGAVLAVSPRLQKGKGVQIKQETPPSLAVSTPRCGICLEDVKIAHSPITVAATAGGSRGLSVGLRLPCPGSHPYCLDCFTQYILSRIDPQGSGKGSPDTIVFPIPCPECPLQVFPDGLTDDVAERTLGNEALALWHRQRHFDSVRRVWCPYKDCGSMMDIPDDAEQTRLLCNSCKRPMCVSCVTKWHKDLTCDQYQALPPGERSLEDRLMLDLARANKWRRCPRCRAVVELVSGCNHMVCRCATHFCFKCGALADRSTGRCTREPSCELWDEEMLFEEEERQRHIRQRERNGRVHVPVNAPPPPPRVAQVVNHEAYAFNFNPAPRNEVFHWMDNLSPAGRAQRFTFTMVRDLECGYCHAEFNSLGALQRHLSSVRWHPVSACCGRFYPNVNSFRQHRQGRACSSTDYYTNRDSTY